MASSSYYKGRYDDEKKKVKDYNDDIDDLEKIEGNLVNDMYDEIGAINKEIDSLMEDLEKAVRHNAVFSNNTNDLARNKEKTVTADKNLNGAVDNIEDVIASVKSLLRQAESNRDRYYSYYQDALEEERLEREREREERLAKLANLFDF